MFFWLLKPLQWTSLCMWSCEHMHVFLRSCQIIMCLHYTLIWSAKLPSKMIAIISVWENLFSQLLQPMLLNFFNFCQLNEENLLLSFNLCLPVYLWSWVLCILDIYVLFIKLSVFYIHFSMIFHKHKIYLIYILYDTGAFISKWRPQKWVNLYIFYFYSSFLLFIDT